MFSSSSVRFALYAHYHYNIYNLRNYVGGIRLENAGKNPQGKGEIWLNFCLIQKCDNVHINAESGMK